MEEPRQTGQATVWTGDATRNKTRKRRSRIHARLPDARLALSLMARDFTFNSPQDDHLDRDTWLERCFPTADHFDSPPTSLQIVEVGGVVLHRYEYNVAGRTYRNVEASRVQDGLVHEVEVYFGGAV